MKESSSSLAQEAGINASVWSPQAWAQIFWQDESKNFVFKIFKNSTKDPFFDETYRKHSSPSLSISLSLSFSVYFSLSLSFSLFLSFFLSFFSLSLTHSSSCRGWSRPKLAAIYTRKFEHERHYTRSNRLLPPVSREIAHNKKSPLLLAHIRARLKHTNVCT